GGIASGFSRISAQIGGTDVPVVLNNGTFRLNGGTATTGSFTHNAGTLTAGGFSTVTVNTAAGATTTQGVTLNFASLSRGPGSQRGTFLFDSGTATFGQAAGLGVTQLTFTTPPTLFGTGAFNTPAAPIIPYAVGVAGSVTTNATDLVTYDTNGVRLLNASEYASDFSTPGTNVKLTSTGTVTTNTNVSVQSLVLFPTAGSTVTLAGTGTLAVTSGTLMAFSSTGTADNVISQNVNFGSAEGIVITPGIATNNLDLTGTVSGTGGLTKAGGGVLKLYPAAPAGNTYTGPTTINSVLVLINSAQAFGPDTSPIQLWATSTGNNTGIQNATQGLALNLTRNAVLNDGFVALDAVKDPATGNLQRDALILSGTVSGKGGAYVANGIYGLTILSGQNTYTGETRVFSGNIGFASEANLGAGAGFDLGTNITAANPPQGIKLFGNWTTSRTVNLSSSSSIDTGPFNATLNGP